MLLVDALLERPLEATTSEMVVQFSEQLQNALPEEMIYDICCNRQISLAGLPWLHPSRWAKEQAAAFGPKGTPIVIQSVSRLHCHAAPARTSASARIAAGKRQKAAVGWPGRNDISCCETMVCGRSKGHASSSL